MGERLGDHAGEIRSLLALLGAHREAIDYDLLTLGLDLNDLGTPRLDWCRFHAVITWLPATSALARSVHGDAVAWQSTEHLLAAVVDALNAGNWQRGGGKGKKPKPLPRPGIEDDTRQTRRMGTGRMSIAEAQEFFARFNRAEPVHAADVKASCEDDGCARPPHARGMCSMHYQRWWRANRA